MSLQHSPEGYIDRKILKAVAAAIRSLEKVSDDIEEYEIAEEDDELLSGALNYLWAILRNNSYTIDCKTNRLRASHDH